MSIGVAAYPESAPDSDGVLGAADAALLRAKTRGRNRVCLYTDGQTSFAAELEGDLVALGRRFARFIGLDEAETAGLLTALAVHETGGAVQDEVQTILGSGKNGDAKPNEVRRSAVDALVYGNERWDGSGYPEGRRGSAIPRVARAFAVCRRYDVVGAQRLRRRRSARRRRQGARPQPWCSASRPCSGRSRPRTTRPRPGPRGGCGRSRGATART